jgi:hypothetical protein
MPSLEEAAFKKLSTALADQRISPAILAMKMSRENVAVNEGMLSMLINYVIIMAEKNLVPFNMVELQQICKSLKVSFEELGLTGSIQREEVGNEYLVV